ncbi:unnamed protein product [Schistosoma turkestanicum]|nr:unnamed protein product [Schistosoma turkestanicum]
MSITLLGFKTLLMEELDNNFDEDLKQMTISIAMQEFEKIRQNIICSFRDPTSFCLDGTQWSEMIKNLAKIVNELSSEPGGNEIKTSSFSSLQERIQKSFRDVLYKNNQILCSNNQEYTYYEPFQSKVSNANLHSSNKSNDLSLQESRSSFLNTNINNFTDMSTNFHTDSKCDNSKIDLLSTPSDEILLNQLQAKPILSISQQPSYLMKSFENTVILTPDVRPTDRRCVSENLLQPMGPLWNEYAKEIDEETARQMDTNLPVIDENIEIFTNLMQQTLTNDFNEMKFHSNNENFQFVEIPVPSEIDVKPIYETACHLFNPNSKSVLVDLSQSFLMDKSKWILPILKLHTDEEETAFQRTNTLPSSKLDELFIQEVEKHKKNRNDMIGEKSIDNFTEKYEKILTELKHEEQKFNKLKLQLIENQYNSNEVALWNTGNDIIVDHGSNNYELLKNCKEKINLLKFNLTNLVNTSSICTIYKTGKDTYNHKLTSVRNTIQDRLFIVWNKLKLTEIDRQHCLLKFCWKHSNETLQMESIIKGLKLLEHAAEYIERREMLLYKLAKIEAEHLNQSEEFSLHGNQSELKCSDERSKVEKKFNKLEKLIESVAKQLKMKFNYTLTFNGQTYLTKMVHDRSDLLYLLREKYEVKQEHNSTN